MCGGCPRIIGTGEPMLLLSFGTVTKRRCQACEGPAPSDVPPLPPPRTPTVVTVRAPRPPTLPFFRPVSELARDFKARSAGREPGEDD